MNKTRQSAINSILQLSAGLMPSWQNTLNIFDISVVQAEALMNAQQRPMTIGHLANQLGITSSASSQLCEVLENRTLINRIRVESDRRIVLVELTKTGHKITKKLLKERLKLIDNLLINLSQKEVRQLVNLHNKMLKPKGAR